MLGVGDLGEPSVKFNALRPAIILHYIILYYIIVYYIIDYDYNIEYIIRILEAPARQL